MSDQVQSGFFTHSIFGARPCFAFLDAPFDTLFDAFLGAFVGVLGIVPFVGVAFAGLLDLEVTVGLGMFSETWWMSVRWKSLSKGDLRVFAWFVQQSHVKCYEVGEPSWSQSWTQVGDANRGPEHDLTSNLGPTYKIGPTSYFQLGPSWDLSWDPSWTQVGLP